MAIELIKPNIEHIEQLKEYVSELQSKEDAEGTNGLYKAISENTFDNWLIWIQQHDCVTYLIVDEEKIVGTINIRYVLNDYLKRGGGHIGYNIRPTERRKGYAKKALMLALEDAYKNGLDMVNIDCYKGNVASKRTIEACGAEFIKEEYIEERKNTLLKYRVDLNKKFKD